MPLIVFNNQEVINQGPLVLGQTTARELTVHIDRLANIFRYFCSLCCILSFPNLWAMQYQLLDSNILQICKSTWSCRRCSSTSLANIQSHLWYVRILNCCSNRIIVYSLRHLYLIFNSWLVYGSKWLQSCLGYADNGVSLPGMQKCCEFAQ